MNKNEHKIREKYEKQGYKMLRGGSPDFLALKIEKGKIVDVVFVEVKYGRDQLSYEQSIYRKAIEFLKAKYALEYLPKTIHAKLAQASPTQASPSQTIPFHSTPGQPHIQT